jgi:hypothetical protein
MDLYESCRGVTEVKPGIFLEEMRKLTENYQNHRHSSQDSKGISEIHKLELGFSYKNRLPINSIIYSHHAIKGAKLHK